MWHRRIEWVEPFEAAVRLGGLRGLALLDSATIHPHLGRYSVLAADPFGTFRVRDGVASWNGVDEGDAPLAALRARLDNCRIGPIDGLPPFQGGAIGAFAYDFGWSLEGRRPPHAAIGDEVHFAFHDVVVVFDHVGRSCWIVASGLPETGHRRADRALSRLDAMAVRLAAPTPPFPGRAPPADWRRTMSRADYCERVERVRRLIRDGDIYQANIAQGFVADVTDAEPLAIYAALRRSNPAPFGAYLDQGARYVLSTSPELFLRLRDGHVETRPIKGTARRNTDAGADAAAAASLGASRKDRAENVMIVDLLRNDLSRVCNPPSVDVPALCEIESYAGLHHLVSSVTGDLAPGRDALDLVAACFPGGSITGAPKVRAMEVIAEIEGRSRGLYCGAIGMLGFDGSLDLSIAIRTIVVEGGAMDLRAGGGITLLSEPEREYDETVLKATRLLDAFAAPALSGIDG